MTDTEAATFFRSGLTCRLKFLERSPERGEPGIGARTAPIIDWARRASVDSAKALGEDLLQRLESFRVDSATTETLLVSRREQESRLVALGEVASSYTFGRLRRSLQKE